MAAERDTSYGNIFRRAAEIVGGETQLCRLLEVSAEQCRAWMDGRAKPSAQSLLKVVDVLVAYVEGKPVPAAKN
jgi:hypothetical protein